jgi:hypothetical protein
VGGAKVDPSVGAFPAFVAVAVAASATIPQAAGPAAPATFAIQIEKPMAKVRPTHFGRMTEEINYGYDGPRERVTREGTPAPNFGATLSDAASMTDLERNSATIVMVSYARLRFAAPP